MLREAATHKHLLTCRPLQFAVHANSAHFDASYQNPLYHGFGLGAYYDKGTFDLETWTCDLVGKLVDPMGSSFQRQCRIESAARWLLVALFVLSVAAALIPLYLLLVPKGKQDFTKQEGGDLEDRASHNERD